MVHSYEFEKGARKWFWLERNRWRTVLSVYPLPLLLALAPALAGAELVTARRSPRSTVGCPSKLRAQGAVLAGLPRDAAAKASGPGHAGDVSAREFATHLTASLDSPYLRIGAKRAGSSAAQSIYWQVRYKRLLAATAR